MYAATLSQVPGDLAIQAVERVSTNWRYASLPKPGDLLGAINDDLLERRKAISRLEMALMVGKEKPAKVSGKVDYERLEKLKSQMRASFGEDE